MKNDDLSRWALIGGSVTAAFLATSCCIGPMLFLVFGISVGSLGFLKFFTPYQLPLSLLAAAIIAVLWYRHLREAKTVCASSLCARYRRYLVAATLVVLFFITYPYWFQLLMEDA